MKHLVSVGPEIAEGFEDFHQGIKDAAPFAKPEHPLMTDYNSDIVGVERLHQQLRKLMSLIYDDIICYSIHEF